jgi:4-hydroxy-tetrahydrodipicolinate reductase
MATSIIVTGALGKMGREILTCALADSAVHVRGCTEIPGQKNIGKDIGTLLGAEAHGVLLSDDIASVSCDKSVVVDFSAPLATMNLLRKISQNNTAVVIGTTGLSEEQTQKIRQFSKKHAVVFSPNMSLGVNLLFYITEMVASKLKDEFDIEIIEAHHRFKKDAPSGTAKRLGEIAAEALGTTYNNAVKNGRAGIVGQRTKKEIGMHAVRGGDIVGDHTVLFAGLGERLELRHIAHSRSTLARGAVLAAKWVITRSPGIYSMKDVLGL